MVMSKLGFTVPVAEKNLTETKPDGTARLRSVKTVYEYDLAINVTIRLPNSDDVEVEVFLNQDYELSYRIDGHGSAAEIDALDLETIGYVGTLVQNHGRALLEDLTQLLED